MAGNRERSLDQDQDYKVLSPLGTLTKDPTQRTQALGDLIQSIDSNLKGMGSPTKEGPANADSTDGGSGGSSPLKAVLPHLLRFSHQCPFADVRQRCRDTLQDIQVSHTKSTPISKAAIGMILKLYWIRKVYSI